MSLPESHDTTSFEAWITDLSSRPELTARGRDVLTVLRIQPQLSAFASSRQLADAVGVNVGTVTRAAQALGYSGWTSLQYEFRSRYVASLSAAELSSEHALQGSTAASSIDRDRAALEFLQKSTPEESIARVASAIAKARRCVVLAQGSFASPGIALAHNAYLAGYDVRHVSDISTLVNTLPRLGERDLLVVINCWHIWESSLMALRVAAEAGVESVVITDSSSSLLKMTAAHQLIVPAEGAGFFPSLVGALAICQAVVVELAQVDPARTRENIEASEREWSRFHLVGRSSR